MDQIYNIVLVDDEDEMRGRIASKITPETGFRIVGSAGNGYDALDILEEKDVDLVLSDIKMPFIDGIELARIIRRDYPRVKVAFITGYDEFNYAKEAISLKVDAYLMKPVTSKDINNFLTSIKSSLDEEMKQMNDITKMTEQYNQLLPVIGDSYLTSMLQSEYAQSNDIEKLVLYGVDPRGYHSFVTFLACFDDEAIEGLKEKEDLKIKANEFFKKVFSSLPFIHSVLISEGLLFIMSIDDVPKNLHDEMLREFVYATNEFLKYQLRIGVSAIFHEFKNMPASYRQAKRALSYANLYNYGNIVYYNELNNVQQKQLLISISEYIEIDQIVQFGREEDIKDYIDKLKDRLSTEDGTYIREYVVVDLSSMIMHLIDQSKVDSSDLSETNFFTAINGIRTYDDMLDYVSEILFQIKELDKRKQLSNSEQITLSALDYISNNYKNPNVSLELLSEELNISISHLSMLFKKHSGTTFTKYLIQYRMDKAKELLDSTELKIVDISIQVGYSDVYYFSHSFKKVVGVSPRKYRKHEVV